MDGKSSNQTLSSRKITTKPQRQLRIWTASTSKRTHALHVDKLCLRINNRIRISRMTGQPGQQRHEKPSKTRKRRKRQQPLTGTRSLRNTREHTNGKSTELDSSPPGLLSTLELGPLTDQRNHERAQEPVTLDAEWQQTTSNSRKNFFFRRLLSPSRTLKQRKKQR